MKNQGFSLIEICIGIALVGIMIGIGGPKIRRYIASGKDTKAIATLASLRNASELYYCETGNLPFEKDGDIQTSIEKLHNYLDNKIIKNIQDGKIEIGGSKDINGNITYGGTIPLTFTNPNKEENNQNSDMVDGVYIWFNPNSNQQFDLKGNKWSEY